MFYLLHASYVYSPDLKHKALHLVSKTELGATRLLVVRDWKPWVYLERYGEYAQRARAVDALVAVGGVASTIQSVSRRQFVGFTNNALKDYWHCRCWKWPPRLKDAVDWGRIPLLEAGIRAEQKFFCETKLRSGGWFDVLRETDDGFVDVADLRPLSDVTQAPLLTVLSYDLETTGLCTQTCTIGQVCMAFWDTWKPLEKDPRSVVVCSQDTSEVNGTQVEVVNGEAALLRAFVRIVQQYDPDICTGFNLSFDNKFLRERMEFHGIDIGSTTRIPASRARFRVQTLESSALGRNERVLYEVPGRFVLDEFLYCKSTFPSLPNFKLDTVANFFVGDGKEDVPFGEILRAFGEDGTREQRGRVAHYCYVDGYLCLQLLQKWSAHVSCMEEAAVCCVNLSTIIDSGRQVKVIGVVLNEIYGTYVFNGGNTGESGGYQGATVIEPKRGTYNGFNDQVACLDYASLYPSCMLAYNICPSRLVRGDRADEVAASLAPGVKLQRYQVSDTQVVTLATAEGDEDTPPPWCLLLRKLLAGRKAVRKVMKTVTDKQQLEILDARQKSLKVSCNSAYGLLGASQGYLSLPELAALTTFMGRNSLESARSHAVGKYGATLIGGDTDSVFLRFPPGPPEIDTPQKRMRYVWELASQCAADITAMLPDPLELENEGIMYPLVIYKKKMYVALFWENPDTPNEKLKIKGLCAVRNDKCGANKRISNQVLAMAIKQNDAAGAARYVEEELRRMKRGEWDLKEFVIQKQLKKIGDAKTPHESLARRLQATDPLRVPVLGTKVEYIFVKGAAVISERARLAADVTMDQVDLRHYFEVELAKPMIDLLGIMLGPDKARFVRTLRNDFESQQTMGRWVVSSGAKRGREEGAEEEKGEEDEGEGGAAAAAAAPRAAPRAATQTGIMGRSVVVAPKPKKRVARKAPAPSHRITSFFAK